MSIEAQSADRENPFDSARAAFEDTIVELSSDESLMLTHSELETLINTRGTEVMRRLLQGHLDERGPGEATEHVVNSDGRVLPYQRERGRRLESIFGTVFVSRIGYEARDSSMLYPLDAELNLPSERYSLNVRKRAAKEALKNSFDDTVETIAETTGAHLPKRQAEELVVRAAADFDAFYSQAEVLADAATGPILALSVDGKGVVMREVDLREATRKAAKDRKPKLGSKLSKGEKRGSKRMATVAAVYTIEPYERTPERVVAEIMQRLRLEEPKRPRPESKRVWASVENGPEEVISEAFEEALRRDSAREKKWVALVDGNSTQLELLQKYAKKHGVELTIILDLMHVLSYLWKAAHAFHEEGSQESEEWVAKRLLEILRGRAGYVAGGIRRSATLQGLSDEDRAAPDTCAAYLLKHKKFLEYDAYLREGFPICTGVVEGTCRHLITDRMDRTGARWRLKGAEAVLRLRSLYASGDFDDYWQFHEEQELHRNHASRYAGALPTIRRPTTNDGAPHLRLVK